ncbi:butyrophilin subfamily 1 member A1-like [Numida meleagris]|uniref:butyrophilin subfamily 1 member A1-like n=1 Tax=Numida meleagris TaxID=8996 RepID=UPI000B3DAC40|nr:butyrophilin subfamily 1 member A1-like [Numida meleagris]
MQEKMEKILSDKLTNTWNSHQKISENVQAVQTGLEKMQVSTKEDLQMLRKDLEERVTKARNTTERSESEENQVEVENQAGRTGVMITSGAMESMREEMEKILSEKLTNTWTSLQKISENIQALQTALENMHVSTKEELQILRGMLEHRRKKGSVKMQYYKVDVTLNADTAHPRLEVSEDGKSMNDTGAIRQVPSREERFDSHIFVLAKEGYTTGRHYWVVDVGKRRNWTLGVASESVARKRTVTLSPQNGFWVIGSADGQEYWAHTDPWTRLTVSGRPQKIGIFLNISANKLSFYNASKKTDLYTFTTIGFSGQENKYFPCFSTGSCFSMLDTEPLKIVQGFDDDD